MPNIPPIRYSPLINRQALRRNRSTTAVEGVDTEKQSSTKDRRRKPDRRQRQLRINLERRQQIRRGRQTTSSDESVGQHINTKA